MKNAPHIYQFIELLAAIAFFLPIMLLAYRKLLRHPFFIWFAIYWAWGGLVNLVFVTDLLPTHLLSVIERIYNLADGPLMLFILYHTLSPSNIKENLKRMLLPYVAIELLVTLITTLSGVSETILVGAGILTILICAICVVYYYLVKERQYNAGNPRMFIYYALLFEYGVSVVTFIFNYIFPERNNIHDSFLIFHLSTIITMMIVSYGLMSYSTSNTARQKVVKQNDREVEIQYL